MQKIASLLLCSWLIPPTNARLLCGVELITSNNMEVFIKLDCPMLLEQHRACCTNHGVCYVLRQPWEKCDRAYCKCVYKIAGKAGGICQTHGETFCNIVKDTGHMYHAYYGGI